MLSNRYYWHTNPGMPHTYQGLTWETWLDLANAYEEVGAYREAAEAAHIAEWLHVLDIPPGGGTH